MTTGRMNYIPEPADAPGGRVGWGRYLLIVAGALLCAWGLARQDQAASQGSCSAALAAPIQAAP